MSTAPERSSPQVRCLVYTGGFGLGAASTYGPFSETLLRMAEQGHVFHVICSEHLAKSDAQRFEFPGGGQVVLHLVSSTGRLQRALSVPGRFIKGMELVRRHRLNLIYVHIIVQWGALAAVLARVCRIPLAYWICSDWPAEARRGTTWGERFWLHWGLRFVVRSAARVITCTHFAKDAAAREAGVGDERFVIIPNAVDSQRFTLPPEERERMRVRLGLGERRVILYLSQLSPRKGILDLIQALPAVRDAVPDMHCLVVGNGPDRERAQELSGELGVADVVTFVGAVPTQEAPLYLAACDVFCVPSLYEGFGRVFAEAMAAGKPVVSTRAGGIPEVVPDGEAGILVERKSPQMLAEALVSLLHDEVMGQEMGETGRRIAARYDQGTVSARYLAALREAAGAGH